MLLGLQYILPKSLRGTWGLRLLPQSSIRSFRGIPFSVGKTGSHFAHRALGSKASLWTKEKPPHRWHSASQNDESSVLALATQLWTLGPMLLWSFGWKQLEFEGAPISHGMWCSFSSIEMFLEQKKKIKNKKWWDRLIMEFWIMSACPLNLVAFGCLLNFRNMVLVLLIFLGMGRAGGAILETSFIQ